MMMKKMFRITGEINKKNFFKPMKFEKEVPAIKKEHAVEQIFAEMGSRHRAKRYQIDIKNIEEINIGETEG
jgi:large subunit ribosomal protein LX